MRLVDADALKSHKAYSEERHEYVVPIFYVDNAPTVDTEKRGAWMQHIEPYLDWVKYRQECSECHVSIPGVTGPYYCPSCGARMDGAEYDPN